MKVAIVTGGTKGIGLAITQKLLGDGYLVVTNHASDVKNAEYIAKKLEALYPGNIKVIHQPLEHEKDIIQFIENIDNIGLLEEGIDALILNAGCTDRTQWNKLTWSQWMHVMDVNINAPAALVRALDYYLNTNASLVFISSAMSVYPHATSVPYSVSKAAVNGLTTSLVKEYANRGIRINAILPGFVETPWQSEKPISQRQNICKKIALHRFAEPDEVAEVVLNVIHSTYMNGTLIKIDGGYSYK